MKRVELYAQVRRAVYVEGISQREAARRFGIDPRTVAKMLAFSVPPCYRRSQPPARPKLDPFVGIIDRILEEDKSQPAKQHHTAKRIFERLRDEHGYGGGISIVRGYVHERRERPAADRSINPDQERMMAKRARAKTVEVNASHVAYMSYPKETAKLIQEAATSAHVKE